MIENKLISEINKKTNLNFFRLRFVTYSKKNNTCEVSIIYPSSYELSNKDREEIKLLVVDFLKLKKAKIIVRINKSFVERDLVSYEVKKFLLKRFPIVLNTLQDDKISINITNDNVEVFLMLEEKLNDYFIKQNISIFLVDYLEKNFCANFYVKTQGFKAEEIVDDFLEDRINSLKIKSDLNALQNANKDKYFVSNKKAIIGEEIAFNPRFISSFKQPCEDATIAGKINFLTEKTYNSKRKKKNLDGTEEAIPKPYFNFLIKDSSGTISAVIFPSKANYHKMHLLKDGDEILVRGKVSSFNDKLEIFVKGINLCKLPNKDEVNLIKSESEIKSYSCVHPIKYNSFKQSNLFESALKFSKEVLNHSFVVYDFETTGLNPASDEIIEIGALKIVNGVFSEVFTTLVNPKRPIPAESTKVNRITNEMVSNSPAITQVISDFYLFCKDCQMVGYNNISFDSQFLINAGKKVGINFANTQIDAFVLAKNKLNGLKNYKLSTVSKHLEVNLIDAHRALNDVIATAECFLKLY